MGERTELIRFALRFCQHRGCSWSLTTDEKPVVVVVQQWFPTAPENSFFPAAPPPSFHCSEKGCLPCVGREEEEEESHDGNIRFGWILERCREVVLKNIQVFRGKQKYWSSEKKYWRSLGRR